MKQVVSILSRASSFVHLRIPKQWQLEVQLFSFSSVSKAGDLLVLRNTVSETKRVWVAPADISRWQGTPSWT